MRTVARAESINLSKPRVCMQQRGKRFQAAWICHLYDAHIQVTSACQGCQRCLCAAWYLVGGAIHPSTDSCIRLFSNSALAALSPEANTSSRFGRITRCMYACDQTDMQQCTTTRSRTKSLCPPRSFVASCITSITVLPYRRTSSTNLHKIVKLL